MEDIQIGKIRADKLVETLQKMDMSKYGFKEGDRLVLQIDTDKEKVIIQPYLEAKIEEITKLDQKIFEIQEGSDFAELVQKLFDSKYL